MDALSERLLFLLACDRCPSNAFDAYTYMSSDPPRRHHVTWRSRICGLQAMHWAVVRRAYYTQQ